MTSWKLCLLVLLAVFVALALEADAGRRNGRRGRRRQNRGQGDNTEVTAIDNSDSDNTSRESGGDNSVTENNHGPAHTGRGRGGGGGGRMGARRGGRGRGRGGGRGRGRGRGSRPGRGQSRRPGRGRGNRPGRGRGNRPGRGRGSRPGRGRGGRGQGRGRRPTNPLFNVTRLMTDYATASGFFGFNLFRSMTSLHDNFVISPISVHAGLGMLLIGAAGETRNQLMRSISAAIHPDIPIHPGFKIYNQSLALGQDENTTFMMANAVYTRPDFNPNNRYLHRLRAFYNTDVSTFDDEEPENAINDWVASKTMNKIQDFIEDGFITHDTLMMLLNAVYFKGLWKHGFDEADTAMETFTDDSGVASQVRVMSIENDFKFRESRLFRSSILKMPYKGERFSLYFILPNDVTVLDTVQASMSHGSLEGLFELLSEEQENRVRVTIPKFKMDTDQALKEMLSSSGLTSIFQDNADFSRMTSSSVKVQEVKHRCLLEIDERGTEAAAATGVEVMLRSSIPEFSLTKPFMFVLRDDAAEINLFMGRYTNPQGSNLLQD